MEAVKEEVERLKEAGAIKEVFFVEWLSNTVVMKRIMESGGYALILLTLIKPAQGTPS